MSAPATYASCCVNVQGLDRHVFIVPRETKLGSSTPVAFGDLYEELKVGFQRVVVFEKPNRISFTFTFTFRVPVAGMLA